MEPLEAPGETLGAAAGQSCAKAAALGLPPPGSALLSRSKTWRCEQSGSVQLQVSGAGEGSVGLALLGTCGFFLLCTFLSPFFFFPAEFKL